MRVVGWVERSRGGLEGMRRVVGDDLEGLGMVERGDWKEGFVGCDQCCVVAEDEDFTLGIVGFLGEFVGAGTPYRERFWACACSGRGEEARRIERTGGRWVSDGNCR